MRGTTLPILIALALLALACPSSVHAGAGASLEGVAHDPAGAPLPGVIVMVSTASEGRERRAVTTGADGRFRIPDLAPETYRVVATRTGWITRESRVAVAAGRVTSLDLVLSQNTNPKPEVRTAGPAKPAVASSPDDVRVLEPGLRDDFELQTWLNQQTAAHLELLAIVAAGEHTLFVLAPARAQQAAAYTALAVTEPLEPERLAARIAQQKNKVFVGIVPLSGDRHAYVFRNL